MHTYLAIVPIASGVCFHSVAMGQLCLCSNVSYGSAGPSPEHLLFIKPLKEGNMQVWSVHKRMAVGCKQTPEAAGMNTRLVDIWGGGLS